MIPHFHPYHSRRGVALVLVLAMIVIMTGLVITVFVAASGERRSAAVKVQGMSASHLASSAPQLVISQIRSATTSGSNPWASQPGMIRTYDANSAKAGYVYKLYSAALMSDENFNETADNPPTDWNTGKNSALYCDINRPVTATSGTLIYPVADPSVANDAFDKNDASKIPGYQRKITATPGYSQSKTDSPTNNPLPMPVRWIYILKNGRMAIPASVDSASGSVAFSADGATPSFTNPVVGRLAFWTDDDTCKVNINTAGYAKNDGSYWSYWDTPVGQTKEETQYLSWGQPWTNEFQRYPGHPASTGLNIVFDSLASDPTKGLTDAQILALTPRFNAGGTKGGTVTRTTAPSASETAGLRKDDRLFASVDEMFYGPTASGKNRDTKSAVDAGIDSQDLEARRFLLTASSRAPEVTLWNTPRATIWPTSQDPAKRTAIDKLIAFCSTIGGQPFYFVRDSPLSSLELLNISQNLSLWTYLQTLSSTTVPGFGGKFGDKYSSARDQVLTSMFDAIRLANLDDRTGPDSSSSTGWSFTAGELKSVNGSWVTSGTYPGGYVAPTQGPNNTRSPGRSPALAEVAVVFARKTPDDWDTKPIKPANVNAGDPIVRTTSETQKDPTDGFMPIDRVNVAFFFGCFTPTAGMMHPGQSRRIKVTGLDSFFVKDDDVTDTDKDGNKTPRVQKLFPSGYVYDWRETDKANSSYRDFGGKTEWGLSMQNNPLMFRDGAPYKPDNHSLAYGPPTAIVTLPYYTYDSNTKKGTENRSKKFQFSGGTVTVELYSPAGASEPYQKYEVYFPSASPLSPMICSNRVASNPKEPTNPNMVWNIPINSNPIHFEWDAGGGRFPTQLGYEQRISFGGDTVLGVHSKTCAFAWEILRSDTIRDFKPHLRYYRTDNNGDMSGSTLPSGTDMLDKLTRRASMMKWAEGLMIPNIVSYSVYDVLYGKMFSDFSGYANLLAPLVPCWSVSSVDKSYTGDFSNGPGLAPEGSLLPKTDEGAEIMDGSTYNESPYFRNSSITNRALAQATLSSPNRQMPSAIYFGSIPTAPWQTLLFRPARAYHPGGTAHYGGSSPPDYLMLDWFHMPIVEPYAISEPFSTAGKINLNSQIMPFGDYMRRETGLRAVLRSARIPVVPKDLVGKPAYCDPYGGATKAPSADTRILIDEEETMKGIRERFDGTDGTNKRVYLTNAEICSIDLIPQGYSKEGLSTFWNNNKTTGDNLRENAYSTLLPRLTARSNTYTVHVTAEALQNTEADGGWREGKGIVTAEWRGSFGIERYIDPNDLRFSGGTASTLPHNFLGGDSVAKFYKFRILGEKRFDP